MHSTTLWPPLDRVNHPPPHVINVLCVFDRCLFASHCLNEGYTVSSGMVQSTMLCVDVGPRAGETAVLAHMQLFTPLTISVAGQLPVHLGKMCFKGTALRKCFTASSAAEWADPCTDGRRGRRQVNGLQNKANPPCPLSISPFLLQVSADPLATSHHLQSLPSTNMGQTPLSSSSSPGCPFPWGEERGTLPCAFQSGPKSYNQYLSSIYTSQQAPTTAHRCESSCGV